MTRMENQLTSPRLGCDGPKSCYGNWHNAVLFAPSDMLVDVMHVSKVVDLVHLEWVDMLSEKLVGIAVYGDRSDSQEMTWSTLISYKNSTRDWLRRLGNSSPCWGLGASSQGICKCYGAFEDPKASGGRKHESRQHAAACPDNLFFGGWLNHVDDMSILGQKQYPVATWTFSISLYGDVNRCLNWI